jgi:hypothetical protein
MMLFGPRTDLSEARLRPLFSLGRSQALTGGLFVFVLASSLGLVPSFSGSSIDSGDPVIMENHKHNV